jgi:hypothetical protein
MTSIVEAIEQAWYERFAAEEKTISPTTQASILQWMLGEDRTRLEALAPEQRAVFEQGMDYRYRVLCKRYLGMSPASAYRNLINRLGSIVVIRNKINTWIALSRDRQRAVAEVLQEVIQEMLNSDRYIQNQVQWIGQCTHDERLRNSLLLTSIEEYCLRPIRNQPILTYRFVNYLRRSQRGGMTQVPQDQHIRMVSDEVLAPDAESSLSLLDDQALIDYQEQQSQEEQQSLRATVYQEFRDYLAQKVDADAVRWLDLYLQGQSQEAIAQTLNLPIKQIYRLREKVGYHAIRSFATKHKPEIVAYWLQTSLQEHDFGLTPSQWQVFWQEISPLQQAIVTQLKAGHPVEELAPEFNLRKTQITQEWTQIYLFAQSIRIGERTTDNVE